MEKVESTDNLLAFMLALDLVEEDYVDYEGLRQLYLSEDESVDSLTEFYRWRIRRALRIVNEINDVVGRPKEQ